MSTALPWIAGGVGLFVLYKLFVSGNQVALTGRPDIVRTPGGDVDISGANKAFNVFGV